MILSAGEGLDEYFDESLGSTVVESGVLLAEDVLDRISEEEKERRRLPLIWRQKSDAALRPHLVVGAFCPIAFRERPEIALCRWS